MKIEEQVLSREQMAHLVELGVDTSDASMCWIKFANSEINEYHLDIYDGTSYKKMKTPGNIVRSVVPTYTIGDLIEKLPSNIDGYGFKATIEKSPNYNYPWTEVVYDNEGVCTEYITSKVNPIHALYGLLCYVAIYHKELIK